MNSKLRLLCEVVHHHQANDGAKNVSSKIKTYPPEGAVQIYKRIQISPISSLLYLHNDNGDHQTHEQAHEYRHYNAVS